MDSNVKSLIITGTAAEDATRFRQKGSRRKRIIKEPEAEVKEKDSQFIQEVKKISLVKTAPITHQAHATQLRPSVQPAGQMQQPAGQMQQQGVQMQQLAGQVQQGVQVQQPAGQVQQSNVILKPLKQPRVKLQPKSSHKSPLISSGIDTTRKARRFHLSVSNLNHRFTRAKRLKDDTEKKPMASIRDYLVGKGVIQQKSKAPEKMLRSMYSDFMLLKDQAL